MLMRPRKLRFEVVVRKNKEYGVFFICSSLALVVQWIELRTSKPSMLVRFQPRAPKIGIVGKLHP